MEYQELKTERLRLSALSLEDAEDILFLRSNLIVNQFVERQQAKTIHDAREFINRIVDNVSRNISCYWCITKTEDSKTIGTICLWNFSEDLKKAEIGYDLKPDFHGKGIMTEALIAVLNFGFQKLKLNSIEAYTHRENGASIALLEKQNFKHIASRTDEDNVNNAIYILEKQNFELA